MIRDKIKDVSYFKDYIEQQNNRIENFQSKIDKNEVLSDRIFAVREKIDSLKFQVLIAKFSLGLPIEDLKKDFIDLAVNMPEFWTSSSSYNDILWMLSLGILFEVDDEIIYIFRKLIQDFELKDYLLNYLLSFRDKNLEYSNYEFLNPIPYKFLKDVIESDSEISVLKCMTEYLDNRWYKGNKGYSWYNIHLNSQKLYSGYWSFESAAILKILGINDDDLKETLYYPSDFINCKN